MDSIYLKQLVKFPESSLSLPHLKRIQLSGDVNTAIQILDALENTPEDAIVSITVTAEEFEALQATPRFRALFLPLKFSDAEVGNAHVTLESARDVAKARLRLKFWSNGRESALFPEG